MRRLGAGFARFNVVPLAVLLAIALPNAGGAAPRTDTIAVAQGSDVFTLDPTMDTSLIGMNVMTNVFDQLVAIRPDGSVAPMMATSWESSPDATVWTFQIRPDATFHNGDPVTPADVVWSYQKILTDPKSPVRVYLTKVKSVETAGDRGVRFTLTEPYAPFDRQTSLISIIPQRAYEAAGAAKFSRSPIGSGPYKVVDWVKDESVKLEAYDKYWAGAPKVKNLLFKPIPSESARAAGLLSGDLDIAQLPPALITRVSSQQNLAVKRAGTIRVMYIGINTNDPVLSDVRVRRAIDHAIDRKAITEKLLTGLGTPSGQMVSPVTFGFDPGILPTAYDPEEAKKLLAQGGYKGEKVIFQFPNNRYALGDQVAQAVAGYLAAVGLNVEIQSMEYAAMFPLWQKRSLTGIHMWAFGPSQMDADLVLNYLYTADGTAYWVSPEVLQLISKQRGEADPAKRKALIGDIWRLSKDQVPYAPLYSEIEAFGVRAGLEWEPRPDGRLLFQSATWK